MEIPYGAKLIQRWLEFKSTGSSSWQSKGSNFVRSEIGDSHGQAVQTPPQKIRKLISYQIENPDSAATQKLVAKIIEASGKEAMTITEEGTARWSMGVQSGIPTTNTGVNQFSSQGIPEIWMPEGYYPLILTGQNINAGGARAQFFGFYQAWEWDVASNQGPVEPVSRQVA